MDFLSSLREKKDAKFLRLLGDYIRQEREKQGLTLRDMSTVVAYPLLSRIERGKVPGVKLLLIKRVTDSLKLEFSEVLARCCEGLTKK